MEEVGYYVIITDPEGGRRKQGKEKEEVRERKKVKELLVEKHIKVS